MPDGSIGYSPDRGRPPLVRAGAACPCSDRQRVDHPVRINIARGSRRPSAAPFLLTGAGRERLLPHPAARAFEPRRHRVKRFCQCQGRVRGQRFRLSSHILACR
jgi:hypothetical protein